jgi:GT2 family glycosyltransferase
VQLSTGTRSLQVDLSIIIVNWNTRDLLAQCLESVFTNPPEQEFEVWVVDNASSDGSAERVHAHFPNVHLIENSKNVGFARANNQAIRQSKGRYILLLNPDTSVLPGSLGAMVRFMDEHMDVGLLGGNVLNPDRTPQICYGNTPTLLTELLTLIGMDRYLPLPDSLRSSLRRSSELAESFLEVGWVLGACMLIRQTALNQVGLLDEGYFMFSEEIDWSRRALGHGWKVVYLPGGGIVHHGGKSTEQVSHRMLAFLYASKARYLLKFEGRASALCFRVAVVFVVITKGFFSSLRNRVQGRPTVIRRWVEIARQAWGLE